MEPLKSEGKQQKYHIKVKAQVEWSPEVKDQLQWAIDIEAETLEVAEMLASNQLHQYVKNHEAVITSIDDVTVEFMQDGKPMLVKARSSFRPKEFAIEERGD